MKILVTGGSGFIGSNFIRCVIGDSEVERIINLDKLSYAADPANTKAFDSNDKYVFEKVCLSNYQEVARVMSLHQPTHVIHLAAESHVDNSIASSKEFINSNVVGTHSLLEACRDKGVRFHHVSTDEVYGEVMGEDKFTEETQYNPRNPYSATKAASDMLALAYMNTYGMKITLSNCCNNYGPNQHDEKFIPTIIRSLINGDKIPVYGKGENVRDWIYVDDHCSALWEILLDGKIGENYLVGADCERTNLQTINSICCELGMKCGDHIEFVKDRLGHDMRYAIDNSKILNELNWKPKLSFLEGISETISFYKEKYSEGLSTKCI
jgi:dTDP-glucose 4,6-dehydratase